MYYPHSSCIIPPTGSWLLPTLPDRSRQYHPEGTGTKETGLVCTHSWSPKALLSWVLALNVSGNSQRKEAEKVRQIRVWHINARIISNCFIFWLRSLYNIYIYITIPIIVINIIKIYVLIKCIIASCEHECSLSGLQRPDRVPLVAARMLQCHGWFVREWVIFLGHLMSFVTFTVDGRNPLGNYWR